MSQSNESPTINQPAARRAPRRVGQFALWLGAIGIVLGVGLYFIPREYHNLGFWESFYATIRLFVLEQDLPSFPKAWPLVLIHFVAPVIAVSAVWSAVVRLFNLTPGLRTRWLSGHVVVCGVGRAGKTIAATLRRQGVRVVGVDLGPAEDFQDWSSEHGIPMVYGNFYSRAQLERAGVARARSVLFASGDDLANLEGAVGLYDWLRKIRGAPRLIWTHVANEQLRYTARQAVHTSGPLRIRFFDTYRIAATRMVEKHFDHEKRHGVTEVTILGFGKFGHDLFDLLARDLSPDDDFTFRVIDRLDRSAAVASLAAEIGVADRVTFAQANIHELKLVDEQDKAFFLCTDDDLGNLTGAMMLARDAGATYIFVRMGKWPMSAVADHLGADRGVSFVNINDLVVEGIAHLPGIFEAPAHNDLAQGED